MDFKKKMKLTKKETKKENALPYVGGLSNQLRANNENCRKVKRRNTSLHMRQQTIVYTRIDVVVNSQVHHTRLRLDTKYTTFPKLM